MAEAFLLSQLATGGDGCENCSGVMDQSKMCALCQLENVLRLSIGARGFKVQLDF